jgi:hypothetical protein
VDKTKGDAKLMPNEDKPLPERVPRSRVVYKGRCWLKKKELVIHRGVNKRNMLKQGYDSKEKIKKQS